MQVLFRPGTENVLNAGTQAYCYGSLLSPDIALIIDQVEYKKPPENIDIVFHQGGQWKDVPDGDKWMPSKKPGYNQLKDATIRKAESSASLSTLLPSGRIVTLNTASSAPMEIITANGPVYKGQKLPALICRMNTNNAVLASCITTNGQKLTISLEPLKDIKGDIINYSRAVKVILEDATGKKTNVIVNPYQLSIQNEKEITTKDFIFDGHK